MRVHDYIGENDYHLKLSETFPDAGLLSIPFRLNFLVNVLVTNRCSQAHQKLRMAHPTNCSPGGRDRVEMLHCCTTCISHSGSSGVPSLPEARPYDIHDGIRRP